MIEYKIETNAHVSFCMPIKQYIQVCIFNTLIFKKPPRKLVLKMNVDI